jgi:hypothetical protein
LSSSTKQEYGPILPTAAVSHYITRERAGEKSGNKNLGTTTIRRTKNHGVAKKITTIFDNSKLQILNSTSGPLNTSNPIRVPPKKLNECY